MKLTYNPHTDSPLDIKPDRRTEVFNFGADNAYPTLVETLIQGSVTAKNCVGKVAKSIYGKGFGEAGKVKVNKRGQSLNDFLRVAGKELATHNNLFIHIGYNGDLQINSLTVIPTTSCRVGKADDKGYSGKIVIYDNWAKDVQQRVQPAKFERVDVYNPNKTVILSQIEKAGSLKQYKGQILHIQEATNAVYSLSDLHPVLEDALLESRAQSFRRRGADKGFLNTKLMVVAPFASEEEEDDFNDALKSLQGAENSGGVLLLEASSLDGDVNTAVKLEDLSSAYNDTMFQYSEEQARKNICIAFEVPLNLVDATDSGLFGNSGELLTSMKQILWESQEEVRDRLTETLSALLSDSSIVVEGELEIIEPFKLVEPEQKIQTNEPS